MVVFEEGRPLAERIRGRFRTDLLLFSKGGEAVLDAIERQGFDVLSSRPVLSRAQKRIMLVRTMLGSLPGAR